MTAGRRDGVASIIVSTALNPSRTATACIVPSVHISPAEPRNSRDSIGSANALTIQDSMEQGVGLSCIDVYTGDRQLDRNPPRIPHRRVPVR